MKKIITSSFAISFIINGDGIIKNIIDKVDTKNSSGQLMDLLH